METLAKIDRAKAKPALEWLEQQIEKTADVNGSSAINVLFRIDPKNPKLLAAALRLLDLQHKNFTMAGVELLGRIGPDAKAAVPRIKAVRNDRHSALRIRAEIALWKIEGNTAEALPVLTAAVTEVDVVDPMPGMILMSTSRFAAQIAAEALGEMGPAAQSALPALRKAQNLNDLILGRNATAAIRKIEKK